MKQNIFTMVLGLSNNPATSLMRFLIKSSAMYKLYLVSLVTNLNWPWFLQNFLSSETYNNLQQFQVKSSENDSELKWLILWEATTKHLENPRAFTSFFNRANDGAKFDYWAGRKALLYFHLFGLMTWI